MDQSNHEQEITCANCQFLKAAQYGRKTLFFCSVQEGGPHGKRRPKNGAICDYFAEAQRKCIPRTDAKTGEKLPGIRR